MPLVLAEAGGSLIIQDQRDLFIESQEEHYKVRSYFKKQKPNKNRHSRQKECTCHSYPGFSELRQKLLNYLKIMFSFSKFATTNVPLIQICQCKNQKTTEHFINILPHKLFSGHRTRIKKYYSPLSGVSQHVLQICLQVMVASHL